MNEEFNFDGIPFKVKYRGTAFKDGWMHNVWTVWVHGLRFPFNMGLGLVNKDGTSRVPDIKGVMKSLLLDMMAGDMCFDEFCSEYSYDEDSRRAYAAWWKCRRTGRRLHLLFSPEEIEAMEKALEDY